MGEGDREKQGLQIVFFSEIKWTYMRTRKQFLLSRLPSSWDVLFLEPFAFGRRNSFRPSRDGRITYVTVPFLRGGTTSRIYNALVGVPIFRRLLSGICLLWIRALFTALRTPSRRVFIASNPYAAGQALSLKHDLLCYDYNDNPFQFPQTPDWVRPGLDALLARSDLIFVVSRHYMDMLAGDGYNNLHLLGNGVEFEHFASPQPVPVDLASLWHPGRPAGGIASSPRPLLLYVGRLGPLIDFDLLRRVSGEFPQALLLLIGPADPMSCEDLSALTAADNVFWMDERPYEVLPGYIQAADVCLAPFKFMHRHTVGVNPNKIYQYLAAARPVVSSFFAELEECAGEMCLARSPGEFMEGVRRALGEPPPAERLRRLAKGNDWKAKAETMAALISERCAGSWGARPPVRSMGPGSEPGGTCE